MQIIKNRCLAELHGCLRLFFVLIVLSVGLFYPNNLQAGTVGSIFERFPWLTTTNGIDPATCAAGSCPADKIEVYNAGSYLYLLITDANGEAKLYNQDGQFYCQNSANYDCVAAYGFGAPIDSWASDSDPVPACVVDEQRLRSLRGGVSTSRCYSPYQITQIDYNGASYFRTEVRPPLAQPDFPCPVQEYFGNVRDCAGTELCRFALAGPPPNFDPEVCSAVQSGQGIQTVIWTRPEENSCTVEDPFSLSPIQEAINREPFTNSSGDICLFVDEIVQIEYNNSTYFRINEGFNTFPRCPIEYADRFYDCEGDFVGGIGFAPTCQSPALCSGLDNATASGTVIWSFEDGQSSSNPQLFTDYPWLTDLVNPTSCTTEQVTAYQSGIYPYLLVANAGGDSKLYNQHGQFYCQQSENYDCVDAYDLGNPIDEWICR